MHKAGKTANTRAGRLLPQTLQPLRGMLLYFNPAQACETSATDKWKVTWHKWRNYSYNATCLGFRRPGVARCACWRQQFARGCLMTQAGPAGRAHGRLEGPLQRHQGRKRASGAQVLDAARPAIGPSLHQLPE